jgi:putative ABC transport system substrate-binding protein
MKYFISSLCLVWVFSAWAAPHIVLVTPRGETRMERVFMEELTRRVGPVRYTLIKPQTSDIAEMKALPQTVAALKPDLIYTWGTATTVAVAGTYDTPYTSKTPIVFAVVADPLRAGLVKSLQQPGRNITGTSHLAPLSAQLLAIREYKKFDTIGVVFNPAEANARYMLDDLLIEAEKMGVKVISTPVDISEKKLPDPESIGKKIALVKAAGAQWLYLGPDTFVGFTHRKKTTSESLKINLPVFTANESAIRDADSLFGMFSPVESMARFTASKASQIILKEKNVTMIPIETLQRFSILINMCVAKKLALYPPLGLLNYADVRLPKKPQAFAGVDLAATDTASCQEIP